ncbi:hypothetical protein XSR1_240032 [Xenorhabdus szentirmaii DSM 16338]|uniref:Uncharacterized protein n=1 Tax=Xenorhabdus szentirmaii DSM 16338 TaxID=1427518 RepID=W1IYS9_9GAMM|nr:hypothetical protein XSR1_240032 [Xenorhabdus szentirmaii DSM 16338]
MKFKIKFLIFHIYPLQLDYSKTLRDFENDLLTSGAKTGSCQSRLAG